MFSGVAGVIASRNKSPVLTGGLFTFPPRLSATPTTLRTDSIITFPPALSPTFGVLHTELISTFPANLALEFGTARTALLSTFPPTLATKFGAAQTALLSTFPANLVSYPDYGVAVFSIPYTASYAHSTFFLNGTFGAIGYTSSSPYPSFSYWSADNGVTWTKETPGVNAEYRAVAASSDRVVAVGGSSTTSNRNAVSLDGQTWTHYTNMPAAGFWYGLAYGNGLFIAGNYSSSTLAVSSDGITWSSQATTISSGVDALVYGGGIWLACQRSSSQIYRSTNDGVTWTTQALPFTLQALRFANNRFFGASLNSVGSIASSTDGVTWVTHTMPFSAVWRPPAWDTVASRYVVVVNNGGLTDIYTSPDLVTWTLQSLPPTFPAGGAGTPTYGSGFTVGLAFGVSPNAVAYRL